MRLAYPELHFVIEFRENEVPVLSIEHPVFLRKLVAELEEQLRTRSGRFVLSKNWNPVELSNRAMLITDPFHVEINARKAVTGLLKQLSEVAVSGKLMTETLQLKSELLRWMEDVADAADYPIQFATDADLTALFKALGVEFDDRTDNIPEQIDNFMRIHGAFSGLELLCCVNFRTFFSEEELRLLYRSAQYRKVRLLMLEGRIDGKISDCERIFILDKDLCEIYDDSDA